MRQYQQIKAKYPDTILLFRMGDFFETFEEDAQITSKVLGITLTRRANGAAADVPLAGFPHHALDTYLPKLVKGGYRVAVCEQLEDPKFARGIVRRDVIEVVTPGVALSDRLLENKQNNYLASVYVKDALVGFAFSDVSTGEFSTSEFHQQELKEQIENIAPSEILIPKRDKDRIQQLLANVQCRFVLTKLDDWIFSYDYCYELLITHFKTQSLKGFDVENMTVGIIAAGAAMNYLQETQRVALPHIRKITRYNTTDYIILDPATKRNLEITSSISEGGRGGTLISILDRTQTPMGGRLFKKWISRPLKKVEMIQKRLDSVQELVGDSTMRRALIPELKDIGDMERLITKISITRPVWAGKANPRDLIALKTTLKKIPRLKDILHEASSEALSRLRDGLEPLQHVVEKIQNAIMDDPPAQVSDGGVIRKGYSKELDELREIALSSKSWVANLQQKERDRTGISSLKVNYNSVFGYYIEVTKTHLSKVPENYVRKQTLVNAERFITPELKTYEEKILNAEEKIASLETELYNDIRSAVSDESEHVQRNSQFIAMLDCFSGLADVAVEYNYTCPEIDDGERIEIKDGRHPVVERMLPPGEKFVPNDVIVTNSDSQILVITGPNMSGKCLTADAMVFTDQGIVPIIALKPKAIASGEFKNIEVSVKGIEGVEPASHFYYDGMRKTIRITTEMGYSIEGTGNHRILVRSSNGCHIWKRLEDIAKDDAVVIDRQIDLWGVTTDLPLDKFINGKIRNSLNERPIPTHLSEDLAYLIGLLIGGGMLTQPDCCVITCSDQFVHEEFKRLAKQLFRCQVVRDNEEDCQSRIISAYLRRFFAALELEYCSDTQKHIPALILRAPKSMVAAFLRGLFDVSGCNESGGPSVLIRSKLLARELHAVLLNFGIVSSLQTHEELDGLSYRIVIRGEDTLTFCKHIGFRSPLKQDSQGLVPHVDLCEVGSIIYLNALVAAIQKSLYGVNGTSAVKAKNAALVSLGRINELARLWFLNNALVRGSRAYQQGYFYDRVFSIEQSEADVFDLSVAGTHSFVADGFINHNSTYLRQVALIVLLAQIGSFVPAAKAHIGIVDRIFTRVGASDNIAQGESTFLVEMHEAANILNNATSKSLVLLDEVGRGTSTFDGISIAWALTEYLHENPRVAAKTLFATHYHELNDLAKIFTRIKNYKVEVKEWGDKVIFLRKVQPGYADHSYGIQVAQMAGLPNEVTQRAKEILKNLEGKELTPHETSGKEQTVMSVSPVSKSKDSMQITLFEIGDHQIRDEIEKLDLNGLTPLEALMKLHELKKMLEK
jgi:DNA mismatch repair protein MutS